MTHDPPPDRPDADVDPFRLAQSAAAMVRERTGVDRHDVALVLGSGWADAAAALGPLAATIDMAELPGFVPATVPGHQPVVFSVALPGALTDGAPAPPPGTSPRALVFAGRTHLYEGRGVPTVVHPVRTAAAAGCRTVVLTNASGGLSTRFAPGSVVLLRDHINLTGRSPLQGPAFVDLTDLYTPRLRALARQVDPSLPEGVYVQMPGPHFETPAEVRMALLLGGDLVGSSTALEAIAARHCGLQVLGLSLVTNYAAGVTSQPVSHQEVLETGRAAASRCGRLLAEVAVRVVSR